MANSKVTYRAQATFARAQEWQATLFIAQLKEKAVEVTGMTMEEYLTYREQALNKLKDRKHGDTNTDLAGALVRIPWESWHKMQDFAMIIGDDIRPRSVRLADELDEKTQGPEGLVNSGSVPARGTAAATFSATSAAESALTVPRGPEGLAVPGVLPPSAETAQGGNSRQRRQVARQEKDRKESWESVDERAFVRRPGAGQNETRKNGKAQFSACGFEHESRGAGWAVDLESEGGPPKLCYRYLRYRCPHGVDCTLFHPTRRMVRGGRGLPSAEDPENGPLYDDQEILKGLRCETRSALKRGAPGTSGGRPKLVSFADLPEAIRPWADERDTPRSSPRELFF